MPIPQEVLIEAYIQWPEFSAEIFNGRLLGITRKHVSSEPYFVETGHDFPASLCQRTRERVEDSLQRCLIACGMHWGPVHIEFRCRGEEFALMEVNPRLAGGFIPELVFAATGIDLIGATVALACGRTPDLEATRNTHASIRFLCAQRTGFITSISGIDSAASAREILDAQSYKRPGDYVEIHHDFRDRIAHVIACDGEADHAGCAADAALKAIKLQISRPAHADNALL